MVDEVGMLDSLCIFWFQRRPGSTDITMISGMRVYDDDII